MRDDGKHARHPGPAAQAALAAPDATRMAGQRAGRAARRSPRAPCAATSTGCASWATRSRRRWARRAATGWSPAPRCRRCCSTTTRRSRSRSACGPPPASRSPASRRRRCGRSAKLQQVLPTRLRRRRRRARRGDRAGARARRALVDPEQLTIARRRHRGRRAGALRLRLPRPGRAGWSSHTGWCRSAPLVPARLGQRAPRLAYVPRRPGHGHQHHGGTGAAARAARRRRDGVRDEPAVRPGARLRRRGDTARCRPRQVAPALGDARGRPLADRRRDAAAGTPRRTPWSGSPSA